MPALLTANLNAISTRGVVLFVACVVLNVVPNIVPRATSQEPIHGKPTVARDWPMMGGTPDRNQVNPATGISFDFELPSEKNEKGSNVLWTSKLGSQTYGSLAVSGGKVFVGTNNDGKRRPKHQNDCSVLICLDEQTGEFLWQLTREKLAQGRMNDIPLQGIVSSPAVENDRLWVVTNRCELMCLDTLGFRDNENDGTYQTEVDHENKDADIVWSLDMIEELGVFPHNLSTSSPVVYGDLVFVSTSNGVGPEHRLPKSPDAPSFLAVDKKTGNVVWKSSLPGNRINHGQWSSPCIGMVNGQAQVCFGGGDGWLYSFEPKSGVLIWKFDLNAKDSVWDSYGGGTRNSVVATPVFHENSVIIGTGDDPEHGEGNGALYRIDATKHGDVSAELGEIGKPGTPNPNSALIWSYGGLDTDGSITGKRDQIIFRRTMSAASVGDGLVFIPDFGGFLHCLDWKTGTRHWAHDFLSSVWGATMLVDQHVFMGTEDGELIAFKAIADAPIKVKTWETLRFSAIYSTPVFANGKLFVVDRTRIYVMSVK